jgi:hypothetical protein
MPPHDQTDSLSGRVLGELADIGGRIAARGPDLTPEIVRRRAMRIVARRWLADRHDGAAFGEMYQSILDSSAEQQGHTASNRGGPRRHGGVFYTPSALVGHLLDVTLDPVIDERIGAAGDDRAAAERALLKISICDPSCGDGRFLVAAAKRLGERLARVRANGTSPDDTTRRGALADVVARCIFGVDLDPIAVRLCRAALQELCGNAPPALFDRIRLGNALLGDPHDPHDPHKADTTLTRAAADARCAAFFPDELAGGRSVERLARRNRFFHWRLAFPGIFARGGFDVVVGNPPFLNQLESSRATGRAEAALIQAHIGGSFQRYTDLSAAFLLLATRIARDGGRVSLVMPQSFLSAGDAAPLRAELLRRCSLTSLWVSNEHLFNGVLVYTCAPTLQVNVARAGQVARYVSGRFDPLPQLDVDADALMAMDTWAHLSAESTGVPGVAVAGERTLANIADATADFRDQYYGLEGFLVEDRLLSDAQRSDKPLFPRVVTSGLIEPGDCLWGRRPTRILKKRWSWPRIDRARMEREGTLGGWIAARLVPKVLVATQTRVIEAVVDEFGEWVPSTPVITVTPKENDRLWHIASALSSPVCCAVAMQRYGGAALSIDAIKLSAKQVLGLPAPNEGPSWDDAAAAFRAAQRADGDRARLANLRRMAGLTLDAYAVPGGQRAELLRWWSERLERRPRRPSPVVPSRH